ncbi:hypothetical protein MMC17_000955 [Xylographa soralifera]|nr:hypothetical protein [Xylographa soralifera]
MPKDREKSINPAAAQRKADKQKALKKSKAAVTAQRTERLAHRNPERLQRQIDDLKALEADAGKLSARDKKVLEELERDVARVRKAKEAVGDKGPPPRPNGDRGSRGGARGGRGGILGKRGRDWDRGRESEGSDTDESVRNIPMPRDTPPPLPSHRARQREHAVQHGGGSGTNANSIPLGEGRGGGEREPHALPERPPEVKLHAQTVYEAKPAVRDLRKEAVSRFVPTVVQKKLYAKKGVVGGRLLEEEEVERLEKEGYGTVESLGKSVERRAEPVVEPEAGATNAALDEEEERFEREMRSVQLEEFRDEDL